MSEWERRNLGTPDTYNFRHWISLCRLDWACPGFVGFRCTAFLASDAAHRNLVLIILIISWKPWSINIKHPESRNQSSSSNIKYPASSIQHPTSSIGYPVSSCRWPVTGNRQTEAGNQRSAHAASPWWKSCLHFWYWELFWPRFWLRSMLYFRLRIHWETALDIMIWPKTA